MIPAQLILLMDDDLSFIGTGAAVTPSYGYFSPTVIIVKDNRITTTKDNRIEIIKDNRTRITI